LKKHLTHLLLAVLLLCAQAFAAAHAIEHTLDAGKGLPTHACELCLSAHDLGAGLVGKIAVPAVVAASYLLPLYSCVDRGALPAPQARQQSPPSA
jgi:hypothetical protein